MDVAGWGGMDMGMGMDEVGWTWVGRDGKGCRWGGAGRDGMDGAGYGRVT